MSSIVKALPKHRLVLSAVDWRNYGRLLHILADRRAIRVTYDGGTLEIMTLSHEHESLGYLLARLIDALTEELSIPVKGGGSTTFRYRKRRRGLEPDSCWWINSEPLVRGKHHIDLRTDPPPDLALEVDITRSSLNRLKIYAALGIPEVWRLQRGKITCHVLGEDERYSTSSMSRVITGMQPAELMRFLAWQGQMDETGIVREFRAWVREQRSAGRLGEPNP